ncbi:archaetidylserine synthase [Halopenitus malekzadehii]|uniref:Archaetidylserine synthase n=1 Tax=Halopenitus malekzadehii TaxID=1267564 RepID=A0A1H6I3Z8_9EURY|nr:protein sorting system archaetidylserine synthase [Halopenitus malekzadehii]SEH43172.1 archaetidylserine synthase [Halopenitus malekzadehii]
MKPRFAGRLGLADAVTVANAAIGFLAVVAATIDVELAARLVLFGAIADALDGIIARTHGSTPAGDHLDSLADVATFGVAPATIAAITLESTGMATSNPAFLAGIAVGAAYVAMAVTRLGLYAAYDLESDETKGVQTTLAATLIAATVLAGYTDPVVLVPGTALLAVLMVSRVTYPDLHAQDAIVMGVVQAITIVLTGYWGRVFAFALLFLAGSYLVFGPWFYWRDELHLGE